MPAEQLLQFVTRLQHIEGRRGIATLTDGQLLDSFLARRNECAFAEIMRRHGPMVWGVCRRVLRHNADAEDAFQATFLVLIRKGDSVHPREQVGNWLYGVAYRTARKAKLAAEQRQAREAMVPLTGFCPESSDHDLPALIDRELSRLPDKYRLPIVLCDLEGRTRKAVAAQLGWPEGTVAGRLVRGRAMLARRLLRLGVAPSLVGLGAVIGEQTATAAPRRLSEATLRACLSLRGGSSAVGLIPMKVSALAESVAPSLSPFKWKSATTAIIVLSMLSFVPFVGTDQAQACNPRRRTVAANMIVCCPPPFDVVPSPSEPRPSGQPKPKDPAPAEPTLAPHNRLDSVLLQWEEQMRKLNHAIIRGCTRTETKDGEKHIWEGEIRYLKPDYFALRMVQKGGSAYRLLVQNGNLMYEYWSQSRKQLIRELPPSKTGSLEKFFGPMIGDGVEEHPKYLVGDGSNPPTFHEALIDLKRRFDLTISRDIGSDNPHYIYIEMKAKSPTEKSFKRAQIVLFAGNMLPRRFWLERPLGDEVQWDFPNLDTATKLAPADFAPPALPKGWETERQTEPPAPNVSRLRAGGTVMRR
jgi:RNA polymerase sigma factor (sigma-70 family)